MGGWHHQCNRHELGQTSGNDERQGGLVCCSPWGHDWAAGQQQAKGKMKEPPAVVETERKALWDTYSSCFPLNSSLCSPDVSL